MAWMGTKWRRRPRLGSPRRNTFFFGLTLLLVTACGVTVVGMGDGDAPPPGGADASPGGDAAALVDASVDAAFEVECAVHPCVKRLAAGYEYTCALLEDRTVRCWGSNMNGALGRDLLDGSTDSPEPGQVEGVSEAVQIAAGFYHACALRADGRVFCWGRNTNGQLGESADGGGHHRALEIPGIPRTVRARHAGGYFTCAHLADRRVFCWGDAAHGNLGGARDDAGLIQPAARPTPVEVTSLGAPDEINAGDRFTCARTGGEVACLGSNLRGALGRGDAGSALTSLEAVPVTGLTGVDALFESEAYHACALAAGRLLCWGYNAWGQVGIAADAGTLIETPNEVIGAGAVVQGSTGGTASCVLGPERIVRCWGSNVHGELGLSPDAGTSFPSPRDVPGLTNVVQIAVGHQHTCALRKDGSVLCWGAPIRSALGRSPDAGVPQWEPSRVVF